MTIQSPVSNYDFQKNLIVAKSTEQEISQLLFEHNNIKTLETSNTKDYDLKVECKKILDGKLEILYFEIKEDMLCGKTGNIALEFSSWERPTGIMTTIATHYVHKLHERNGITYWITNTWRLKKMVEDNLWHRIANGGDKGSNSMNYLFTLDVFKKYSKQLFVKVGDIDKIS